ncbi:MAG TPA: hypothetical protein VHZ09_11540 [Acidobacteriaceae bacterium]|nr:hypothetical protein [Acidobacteriaceae bacterium]
MAVLTVGCSSDSRTASAASGLPVRSSGSTPGASTGRKAGGANYVSGSPLSGQLTTATITDPSLNNVQAMALTIPAGWKLQGIVMISPCTSLPSPVFRAYSADALMQYRMEPLVGWSWSARPNASNKAACLPFSKTMTAVDLLQYYVGTIQGGVHVVGATPVESSVQQQARRLAASANQQNSRLQPAVQSNNTADTAALRIETVDGSFVVEERLQAMVECSVRSSGPLAGGLCWARVDVLTAPQGKLDALMQLVDGKNLPNPIPTQQWEQAFMQRQQRQGQQMLAALAAQEKQESQMLYQQFQQIMARSQAEHQQFMQQQESQFESAMNNANASMNAQTTAASDWVDYSLDQQTVEGANGVPTKVSSAYSQTWTNGSQWYQTNDPNSNPNGVLQGNWTLTTQVHGNGEPK